MHPVTFFTLIAWVAAVVGAAPRPAAGDNGVKQTTLMDEGVSCEKVERYTTEWFLKNTKPQYRGELLNNALFYSQGMSSIARKFAKSGNRDMTTIWEVWPCYLYNHDVAPSNPMRCVHADDTQRQFFFENMSRAFAQKARNFSTVLHSSKNYKTPPTDGIWAKVEFPALLGGGVVHLLEKTNENKSLSEIFWQSKWWLESLKRPWRRSIGAVQGYQARQKIIGWEKKPTAEPKRASYDTPNAGYCSNEKELSFFDRVAW